MSLYMQDDPMQGILFNAKSTIRFRNPLNRREKLIAGLRKIKTVRLSKTSDYSPTFRTDLMPSEEQIAQVRVDSQFSGSTTKIRLN